MDGKFYSITGDYGEAAKEMLLRQKEEWPQLRDGYLSLDTIKVKEFNFDGVKIKIQFNAGRIVSSAAKVDPKSIKERKCFLCPANLPLEQTGIYYKDDLIILSNPFPIFKEHFTIPKKDHIPQTINGNFESLLRCSKDLSKYYVVFYNGPKCGASAPDHMHLQAGEKGFMPIESDRKYLISKYGKLIKENEEVKVYAVDDNLRRYIVFQSNNEKEISKEFYAYLKAADEVNPNTPETMMNIISVYDEEGWTVIVFPRHKHRPSHYFELGDKNILLSPASVDIGGVCITPKLKDFDKITEKEIKEIFDEVMLSKENFELLISKIK